MSKKMIAPIVVTVIMLAYFLFYFGILVADIDSILLKLLFVCIPVALAVTIVCVCMQRINEIRSGEICSLYFFSIKTDYYGKQKRFA